MPKRKLNLLAWCLAVQHPLEELRTLFLVGVGSSQEESFANPGHTRTFACRYCFNVFLQV